MKKYYIYLFICSLFFLCLSGAISNKIFAENSIVEEYISEETLLSDSIPFDTAPVEVSPEVVFPEDAVSAEAIPSKSASIEAIENYEKIVDFQREVIPILESTFKRHFPATVEVEG